MTTPTTDARERADDLLAWAADGLEHAQADTLGEHDDIDTARVVRLRTLDREIRTAVRAAVLAEVRARVEAERKAPCDEWCAEMERCDCGFAENNAAVDAILAALAALEAE